MNLVSSAMVLATLRRAFVVTILSTLVSAILNATTTINVLTVHGGLTSSLIVSVAGVPVVGTSVMANISLVLLFVFTNGLVKLGRSLNFSAILATRVAFGLPCIVLSMVPGLGRASSGLLRTTLSLNYAPVATFFGIVLPSVSAKVVANVVVTFALSLSSFMVDCFAYNGCRALPVIVCGVAGGSMAPSACTLSALVFVVMFLLLVLCGVLRDGDRGRGTVEGTNMG